MAHYLMQYHMEMWGYFFLFKLNYKGASWDEDKHVYYVPVCRARADNTKIRYLIYIPVEKNSTKMYLNMPLI